jgi:Phytochelatin synthase
VGLRPERSERGQHRQAQHQRAEHGQRYVNNRWFRLQRQGAAKRDRRKGEGESSVQFSVLLSSSFFSLLSFLFFFSPRRVPAQNSKNAMAVPRVAAELVPLLSEEGQARLAEVTGGPPASTAHIIGAEKALFHALKKKNSGVLPPSRLPTTKPKSPNLGRPGLQLERLIAAHEKQIGRTHCGPRSLATSLAALQLPPSISSLMTGTSPEESVLACGEREGVLRRSDVATGGMCLRELDALALACVPELLTTRRLHAGQSDLAGPAELRRALCGALESSAAVVANYHMTTLGQPPYGGHFACVGAVHEASDSVLLLDPWPETSDCWAPVATLFAAMDTVDQASDERRGILVLAPVETDGEVRSES